MTRPRNTTPQRAARCVLAALLYAAAAVGANPALAAPLTAELRTELEALRSGAMKKLVIHDAPRAIPALSVETPDGGTVALADSNGKLRILNFWATWCAPCRMEKPSLDTLNAELAGPDFEIIAIATGRNSLEGIKKFNSDVGVTTLKTYLDPQQHVARQMGVLGLPITVVLDREGNEIARLQGGADWQSDSARAILARLLEAGV
ncbi:TlpA family protein disulfide reductase [Halovulum marinum]|nr:TlpA disulfide reductase family protein [Halovulum marinum]